MALKADRTSDITEDLAFSEAMALLAESIVCEKGAESVGVRQSCSRALGPHPRARAQPSLPAHEARCLLFYSAAFRSQRFCRLHCIRATVLAEVDYHDESYFLTFVFATRAGVACCKVAIPVVSAQHKFSMT